MSSIGIENGIGTFTGLVSEASTYLDALFNSSPVQVFKTTQTSGTVVNNNNQSIPVNFLDYNQVFSNAQIMKCTVRASSKTMDHPLETGQIISDYKIILPVEIILPMVVSAQYYRDTYAEIYSLFATSQLLTVQSRASNFSNMIITDMPDEERSDMFDVIMIELRLKQVLLVQPVSSFAPTDPTQANTQNSGQQQASATTLPANSTTNNPAVTQAWIAANGSIYHDLPDDPNF